MFDPSIYRALRVIEAVFHQLQQLEPELRVSLERAEALLRTPSAQRNMRLLADVERRMRDQDR